MEKEYSNEMTTENEKYEKEIEIANYIIEVGSDEWMFDMNARTVLPLAKAFLEIINKKQDNRNSK